MLKASKRQLIGLLFTRFSFHFLFICHQHFMAGSRKWAKQPGWQFGLVEEAGTQGKQGGVMMWEMGQRKTMVST